MTIGDNQIVEVLSVAFGKMFPDLADKVTSKEVQQWLAESLVGIVEYSGTLPQETRKQRDRRMECHKVYDGDFKELASNLRNTYPDSRELSAQELILKVYNGISSIYDVLGVKPNGNPTTSKVSVEDTSKALDSDTESTVNARDAVSESSAEPTLTSVQSGGKEIKDESPMMAEESTEPVHEVNSDVGSSAVVGDTDIAVGVQESTDKKDSVAKEVEGTKTAEMKKGDVSAPKVQVEIKNNMEDTTMANAQELLQMAQNAANDMGGAGNVAPTSNVTAGKEDKKAAEMAAIDLLNETANERKAWGDNNRVEAVIIVKQPAAKRALGTMGKLSYATSGKNATTPEAEIDKKIQKFISCVYGSAMSEADWKALPEESKYAQVIKVDNQIAANRKDGEAAKATNLEKAKKVYEVLSAIKNNPTGEFAAFVNDKNVSYNWKGVVLAGKPMNRESLIATLFDCSNGFVLGDGSNPEDAEKRVSFQLGKAADRASAKTTGIAGATHKADKKFVVSVKNKAAFTANEAHVVCLFTQPLENADSKASFPVAIKPEGFDACAGSFSYVRKNEKGEDAYRENKDAKGNPKFKTGVYTMRVSVPVSDVKKEVDEQFKKLEGYEHPAKLAAYWGVTLPTDKDITKSDKLILDMMASYFMGEVGGAEGSSTLKSLENVRKAAQAEADAEEAAQLDQ